MARPPRPISGRPRPRPSGCRASRGPPVPRPGRHRSPDRPLSAARRDVGVRHAGGRFAHWFNGSGGGPSDSGILGPAQTSRRRWRPDGSCAYASNVVPRYRKDLLTTWQPSPTLRHGPGLASARCHACSTAAIRCARRRAPRCTRPWRRWTTARLDLLLAAGPSVRGSSACSSRTSTSRPRTSVCAASSGRCSRTASRSCCTTSTRPIAPVDAWWKFHGTSSMG